MTINELRSFGVYCWGERGGWIYDEYDRNNRTYFSGRLEPCGIIWGLTTAHAHSLGNYQPEYRVITLHESILEPKDPEESGRRDPERLWNVSIEQFGEAYTSDVLLHEMIHHAVYTLYPESERQGKTAHNNPAWVTEVNRISGIMGYHVTASLIAQRRIREREKGPGRVKWVPEIDGALSQAELSTFPHSVRPAGYYECNT